MPDDVLIGFHHGKGQLVPFSFADIRPRQDGFAQIDQPSGKAIVKTAAIDKAQIVLIQNAKRFI